MLVSGLVLLAASLPTAPQRTPGDTLLRRVMDATVFISGKTDRELIWGTGFIAKRQGSATYVVTNEHVVGPCLSSGEPINVSVFSGTKQEKTLRATVVSRDAEKDLALLRVEGANLPAPILPARTADLQETMPVLVLGFPFGELLSTSDRHPTVTVVPAVVSSIRFDDAGKVRFVQIHGEIHPGNSGGPVVDQAGNVVGVVVGKVLETRIGVTIPAAQINELFLGSPGETRFEQIESGPDWVKYRVRVSLSDPMNNIVSTSIVISPREDPDEESDEKAKEKPKEKKAKNPASSGSKLEQKLKMGKNEATGEVTITKGKGKGVWVQAKCARKSRQIAYGSMLPLAFRDLKIVELLALPKTDSDASVAGSGATGDGWLGDKSADSALLPSKKQVLSDITMTTCQLGHQPEHLAWSPDGKFLYLLQPLPSRTGSLLRKIALPEFRVTAAKRFDYNMSNIQSSAAGLVIRAAQNELWLLNPENCTPLKRMKLPSDGQALVSNALKVAICPDHSGLTIVDLENATSSQIQWRSIAVPPDSSIKQLPYLRYDASNMLITADGRYLLAAGQEICRFRIREKEIECEEVGRSMPGRMSPIGSDPRHVIVQTAGSSKKGEELDGGAYLVDVESLRSQPVRLAGQNRNLTIDGKSGRRYLRGEGELWVFSGSGIPERRYKMPSSHPSFRTLSHPSGLGVITLDGPGFVWLDFSSVGTRQAEPLALPKPVPGDAKPVAQVQAVDGLNWYLAKSATQEGACAALSQRGDALFVVKSDKTLRKYRLPEIWEESRLDLGHDCTGLASSSAGLLLKMEGLQQLWVVNEKDLSVSKSVAWCGGLTVAAAPGASVILGSSDYLDGGLFVCDLANPEKAQLVYPPRSLPEGIAVVSDGSLRPQFRRPQLSFDGKYLVCQGDSGLFKFEMAGTAMRIQEAIQAPRSSTVEATFSPDSKYVALDKEVYRVGNLKTPVLEFQQKPEGGVAFDPHAGRIYSMTGGQLVMYGRDGGVERQFKSPAYGTVLGLREAGFLVVAADGGRTFAAVDLRPTR